ncbi:amidase [Leucobacter sp. CSA1]|uniref:Amidase n=1 Tax=Leucobacter chromiisoli TaxID=2796471 RepID=A0A934Q862_9MICO|nr:amidase [Leucobacter chromiisoli]MBK0420030.1 amidase [Leucobacter chromiisoli]
MSAFAPWSLAELVADLRSGALAPADALERSRERIDATDAAIRAWVVTDFERAGARDASGPASGGAGRRPAGRGALAGAPIGVKDIIDVRGLPTRCGSALRAGAPASASDAGIVTAWRAAGAIPVGKTVTTEFAYFAPGPTGNPAAPGRTPGGSSSGSAAAVASGQVPLALGSQTAASVTRPAAFCGVAALVMTRGRFAADGVVGLARSLDSHGFFAAGAEDLGVAWSAVSGEAVERVEAPRLLVWDAASLGGVSDDMASAVDEAISALRSRGAEIERFPEPALVDEATAAHLVVMGYEAAVERAEELARPERLSPQLRALLEGGRGIPRADYDEARGVIERARRRVEALTAEGAAIIGPAALGAAPEGLSATGDPILSRAWQALGLPVVAVPGLHDPGGRPLGVQLIGEPNRESRLLGTAAWVQERLRP